MNQDRTKRKLTAIFSADVVGFSRLMRENEASTVRNLEENKRLIFKLVEEYEGRVVDAPGDNILAEFSSVVKAVDCAIKIQKELKIKNAELVENRRMEFRIGINLGDVIEEEGRIYGDGVNIAARIEGLAQPGGICMSRTAYDQVKTKLDLSYEYLGEHDVKNIDEPVRVYRVLTDYETAGKVIGEKKAPRMVSRRKAIATFIILIIIAAGLTGWIIHSCQTRKIETASIEPEQVPEVVDVKEAPKTIAVIPFVNLSSDLEQEYFVDGLSEELINCLTQIPDLHVTSRQSSFTFKNSDKTTREIAEILGRDYILEGSVRKAGNELRITAQLIHATDDRHLWSETYNKELKDIYAVQEDIANSVADKLKLTLEAFNLVGGTDNVEAYGHYLVAIGQMWDSEDLDTLDRCIESLDAAVSLDPEFALAWTAKADFHCIRSFRVPAADRISVELDLALKTAQRAIQIEPDLPQAYISLKNYYDMKGDYIEAERSAQKALELLTGTSPDVESMIALFNLSVGFLEKAQGIYEKILPNDPFNKLARADYMLALAFRGYTDKAEEEYDRVRTFFEGDWELGDNYITILRLGDRETLSRDKILYSSPIFDAVMEHLDSPEHALSELRRMYTDLDNPSYSDLEEISILAAHFGDAEFALEARWEAMRLNTAGIFWVWSPVMHDVRKLPRFKEFVRDIGLVDYWNEFGWPDLCHQLDNGDFECD